METEGLEGARLALIPAQGLGPIGGEGADAPEEVAGVESAGRRRGPSPGGGSGGWFQATQTSAIGECGGCYTRVPIIIRIILL